MKLRKLLTAVYGIDETETIRFYTAGNSVMVRSDSVDAWWCDVPSAHKTEIARSAARRKAEVTADALNAHDALVAACEAVLRRIDTSGDLGEYEVSALHAALAASRQ